MKNWWLTPAPSHSSEPSMPKQSETFAFADEPAPTKPAPAKPDHAQLLRDCLHRWSKPTISARDIRIWGPKILHNREGAIRSAQILAAHGVAHPHHRT